MIFSIVKLTTNTGISDQDLMVGTPNVDDVKRSKLYKELVEDCGGSKYILAAVRSVEIENSKVDLIDEYRYAIIPEGEFTMRGETNEIHRKNKR
ncbi:MAG: hypothetical protein VB064_11610 [Oscillospiraceae bacterium]|nr:hypothetical protein [Oscillospiraceae bacterium]